MTVKLEPGDTAPDFTLPSDTGEEFSLSSLRGHKVVLFAYPRAMTPGCTKEACDFRDSFQTLKDAGYVVLGISPDTPEKLTQFVERDGLNFPLLSDPDKTVLESYGAFGEKKNYGKLVKGVIRSTFVIDEEGRIEQALYNVRATGHVGRVLKKLDLAE